MTKIAILVGALMLPAAAWAQSTDAERDHAVDQLVGDWTYNVCVADGADEDCSTVERTYEPAGDGDLVYYTETVGGEQREGFVGYDAADNTFIEYDYPQDWSRDEFEQTYSERTDLSLHGEEAYSRTLEWQMNENGDAMSLRTASGEVTESTADFLGVVFSKVPIVGSDPIIGGDNN